MNRLISLSAALLLAACATHDIVNTPVPVEVPIGVKCQTKAVAVPAWATVGVTAQSSMFDQVKALAATNEQRKAYEGQLVAANKACQ